jgi:hypothetical protein
MKRIPTCRMPQANHRPWFRLFQRQSVVMISFIAPLPTQDAIQRIDVTDQQK